MRGAVLLAALTEWDCPNCYAAVVTAAHMSNRFHSCPGLHGLTAPLRRAGTRCAVTAELREDYRGGEVTQDGDDGQPYMAVRTTRDDGEDLAVLAPCATGIMG